MLKKLVSPGWAVLEYGWYPLLLFIATPYFLHMLGTEKYGHWMMLTATVGFGGVLFAGTGAATVKEVSAGLGRGDDGHAERTVRSSLALAMLGGSALAAIVLAVFWFAGGTLFDRMGDRDLVRLTGVAAAVLIWLEQIDNVFASALKGAEQFGRAARIEIASKTAQILIAAAAVTVRPELRVLYSALVFVACVRLFAKAGVARSFLRLGSLRPSFDHATGILHFAKWGWLQGIGSMLFGVADRMLVGAMLGATSLAYYSIASQLALQIHAISAAGLSVIFPKISRKLEGRGSFSLRRVAELTMAGNFVLSSALALALYLLGPRILTLWLGPDIAAASVGVLRFLVVAYWILALNVVPYYILLGMGRIRFVGLVTSASGVIAVVAMYLAVQQAGLIGAPVGRGVYAVLTTALLFPIVQHLYGKRRVHIPRGEAS